MTLADAAVAKKSHAIKHDASQNAMKDIRLGAIAVNAGSIGPAHADVMQHGCLLDKFNVDRLPSVDKALAQCDGQICDPAAMRNQHPVIVVTGCIVSLND